MSDDTPIWRQAEFESARDRAQQKLDEINDVLAEREARGAPASTWQPPQPESKPEQRERQPEQKPRREMAPPEADKVTIPTHDPATGRVVAVHSFEGATLSTGLMWEKWVKDTIASTLDRRLHDEIWKQIHAFAKAWGEDEAKDWREARDRFAEIERRLERIAALEARLQQLEARSAAPPRLVESSDAAD